MRLGAAIIVAIGALIAMLILFERSIGPELQRVEAEIKKGYSEKLNDYRDSLMATRGCFWTFGVAAIVVLSVCFINVSRRMSRRSLHYGGPPTDDFDIICRLSRERSPFQFSTLTLLALMLAVAIVCSAIVYPLNN